MRKEVEMIYLVMLKTPPPLGPLDPLLIAFGAACLISAPIRLWRVWKGLDAAPFHVWGGLADIIIGVGVIMTAIYW